MPSSCAWSASTTPRGLAVCADEAGASIEVDILLVAPVEPGDRLLVHAGTAIARVEP